MSISATARGLTSTGRWNFRPSCPRAATAGSVPPARTPPRAKSLAACISTWPRGTWSTPCTRRRADAAGRLTTTDGPFLETKEAVGGYYLIEAGDLDEVTGLAARLYEASAGHSAVEIRPVVERG